MPRALWFRASASAVLLHSLCVYAQQPAIVTVAGGAPPPAAIPATQASIGDPPRVAVDAAGNVYFASLASVFEVNSSGVLVRIAGTGRPGYSGDGGPALNAQLFGPDSIAVDAAGDIFVADRAASAIREIAPDGTISTYAGSGVAGYAGDGGPAVAAQLNQPTGLAVDAAGVLYIADTGNHVVRAVERDGKIQTIAGSGFADFWGDDGLAAQAALNSPEGLAVDSSGTLYIADTRNDRVRAVTPDGMIRTIAGTGDPTGLILPTAVAVDPAGNLYIADYGNSLVRMMAPDGTMTTVAGSEDGAPLVDSAGAVSVRLNGPTGLAVDAAGDVFFTEGSIGSGTGLARGDFRVWEVSNAVVTAAAGNGLADYSGDGAPATAAQFNLPAGMVFDSAGNLYIADTGNHRVRKITPDGMVTTVAGTGVRGFSGDGGPATNAELDSPEAVAFDPWGSLWIADTGNSRIRRVGPDGVIVTFIGNGNSSYFGDGLNDYAASVNHPQAIAIDANGIVYVADTLNNVIRRRAIDRTMSTIAGTGMPGYWGAGGPATSALLNHPTGVAVDEAGNIYVVDAGNQSLRMIAPDGTISTIASQLNGPIAVAVSPSGAVYVTAADSHQVLAAGASVSVIAGSGACCYAGDGGPAAGAALYTPSGIAADAAGNVFISDAGDNAIREVSVVSR